MINTKYAMLSNIGHVYIIRWVALGKRNWRGSSSKLPLILFCMCILNVLLVHLKNNHKNMSGSTRHT